MAITHHFKGSTDQYGYGYYGFIEDGKLVIGEEWPREGGVVFRGTYQEPLDTRYIKELKERATRLYNSIVKYFSKAQADKVMQRIDDRLHNREPIEEVTTSPAGVLWKVKLTMANAKQVCVLVRGTSEASVIQKLFPIVPEVLTLQTPDARVIAVCSADISVAEFLEG